MKAVTACEPSRVVSVTQSDAQSQCSSVDCSVRKIFPHAGAELRELSQSPNTYVGQLWHATLRWRDDTRPAQTAQLPERGNRWRILARSATCAHCITTPYRLLHWSPPTSRTPRHYETLPPRRPQQLRTALRLTVRRFCSSHSYVLIHHKWKLKPPQSLRQLLQ